MGRWGRGGVAVVVVLGFLAAGLAAGAAFFAKVIFAMMLVGIVILLALAFLGIAALT